MSSAVESLGTSDEDSDETGLEFHRQYN
jgi:hypothetical protein